MWLYWDVNKVLLSTVIMKIYLTILQIEDLIIKILVIPRIFLKIICYTIKEILMVELIYNMNII